MIRRSIEPSQKYWPASGAYWFFAVVAVFLLLNTAVWVYNHYWPDFGGGSMSSSISFSDGKYGGIISVSREFSMGMVHPSVYGVDNPGLSGGYSSINGVERQSKVFITFDKGRKERKEQIEKNHVYFTSFTEILRKVSFEELGIQPVPRKATREPGWYEPFVEEINQKIKEYMEKHAEEIYGEETEKSEPQS